jgi:hypothetical protein
MGEIWKDIPGYEGLYQASSLGNIKSLDRFVKCAHGGRRSVPGRILKPGRFCKAGHVSVTLGHGANGSPVHYLVMLTFKGERPTGADIRHLDGNPKNNNIHNLCYGSRTENILDVYHIGGTWRKLGIEDVITIRNRLSKAEKGSSIARDLNLSQGAISNIKTRKTFGWLK